MITVSPSPIPPIFPSPHLSPKSQTFFLSLENKQDLENNNAKQAGLG